MSEALLQKKDQKRTKRYILIATIIYVLLFPFFLLIAQLSGMIADTSYISSTVVTLFILAYFCIPLSILFTLYIIWSRYLGKNYRSSRRFCFLPLYVFVITQILAYVLVECGKTAP